MMPKFKNAKFCSRIRKPTQHIDFRSSHVGKIGIWGVSGRVAQKEIQIELQQWIFMKFRNAVDDIRQEEIFPNANEEGPQRNNREH